MTPAPQEPAEPAEAAATAGTLWALARPRLLPYVLGLVVGAYFWAHWDRALPLRGGRAALGVLVAWSLLHAGTLWLNAAVDRDEGEVLLGASVPVPRHLERFGAAALLAAVAVACAAHPVSGLACACCALMAVAYSHPAVLLKGHPIGGPAVNVLGYGLLSPLAGWAVVDVPPNLRTALVWGIGGLGVLGTYFLAQAFQAEEDRARGYRTLVATHGPAVTLGVARACIATALLGGMGLAAAGWLPRACLVGLPLWVWVDRWLGAWSREPDGGTEASAREAARRLLVTGLVGLALAFGQYTRESLAGLPVAGLGTAAGHPADRPRLPAARLRALDQLAESKTPGGWWGAP